MSETTTRAEEGAKAIRDELLTYATQLRRMETQAGMGGPDLSVRVKDPDWLIRLMIRAASALEVRRAEAAEAHASALRDRVAVLESALKAQADRVTGFRAGMAFSAGSPEDEALRIWEDAARAALNGGDHV